MCGWSISLQRNDNNVDNNYRLNHIFLENNRFLHMQISCAVTAQLISTFIFVKSIVKSLFLNPNSQPSSVSDLVENSEEFSHDVNQIIIDSSHLPLENSWGDGRQINSPAQLEKCHLANTKQLNLCLARICVNSQSPVLK